MLAIKCTAEFNLGGLPVLIKHNGIIIVTIVDIINSAVRSLSDHLISAFSPCLIFLAPFFTNLPLTVNYVAFFLWITSHALSERPSLWPGVLQMYGFHFSEWNTGARGCWAVC